MVTTKTYNGIEFIDLGMARLFAREKFASKDDAETALERALCEYVKDEPMNYRWSLSAELESREEVDLESDEEVDLESDEEVEFEIVELELMGNDCGETPWSCTHIKYYLGSECYRKDEQTDNYEYYRMIGYIKNLIDEYELESDEDIKEEFAPIWAERFASAVRMYPNEFTAEEREQGERISKAILDNEYEY